MNFRKLIFWPHLVVGLSCGLVVTVVAGTGVLLTYEKQMIQWLEPKVLSPSGAVLPIAQVLERVAESESDTPTRVMMYADPNASLMISFGREKILFVDPRSGAVLGAGAVKTRSFFKTVRELHTTLAFPPDSHPAGRAIVGAANIALLFLIASGLFLWFPRAMRWPTFKAGLVFNRRLRGRARDWNWHNVIGFWMAIPLALIVVTGVVMSYPWANDWVFRIAGDKPPVRQAPAPKRAAPPATRPAPLNLPGNLQAMVESAAKHVDGWKTIGFPVPNSKWELLPITIEAGTPGQPQKRGQLFLDVKTGATSKWVTFSSQSPGPRLRTIVRFLHTGEIAGLGGQTLAGLASAGTVVLVYTGFALSWRRFFSRKQSTNGSSVASVESTGRSNPDTDGDTV